MYTHACERKSKWNKMLTVSLGKRCMAVHGTILLTSCKFENLKTGTFKLLKIEINTFTRMAKI